MGGPRGSTWRIRWIWPGWRSPGLELRPLRGLVVLDEIQRLPDVFPLLRVLADRPRTPARFLVLGSASPELLRQTSETLAGRVAFHELDGFDLREVSDLDRLWLQGAFPRAYLARSPAASRRWRDDFIRTFLERDLPDLGSTRSFHHVATVLDDAGSLARPALERSRVRQGVRCRAHDGAALSRSPDLGVRGAATPAVAREHRQAAGAVAEGSTSGTREFCTDCWDSVHAKALVSHPKVGASWEGFVIRQITRLLGARSEQCFHWSTYSGAELGLLVVAGNRRYGFEVKRTEAPRLTPSMRSAMETLDLQRLDVVHAGERLHGLGPRVRAPACRAVGDRASAAARVTRLGSASTPAPDGWLALVFVREPLRTHPAAVGIRSGFPSIIATMASAPCEPAWTRVPDRRRTEAVLPSIP